MYFNGEQSPVIITGFGPSALAPFNSAAGDVPVLATGFGHDKSGTALVKTTRAFPLREYRSFEK